MILIFTFGICFIESYKVFEIENDNVRANCLSISKFRVGISYIYIHGMMK